MGGSGEAEVKRGLVDEFELRCQSLQQSVTIYQTGRHEEPKAHISTTSPTGGWNIRFYFGFVTRANAKALDSMITTGEKRHDLHKALAQASF